MKFSIEDKAKNDINLAINWLSKSTSREVARSKIKETVYDVKNQLIAHPYSGKKCKYLPIEKYREIIKGNYRTVYKVEEYGDVLHVIIILFCHVKMEYKTLLSQSNIFIEQPFKE
tara:strand:- start:838 stop:1182 length:345 start_codon:yes stop_codon:yes gene_type:complete